MVEFEHSQVANGLLDNWEDTSNKLDITIGFFGRE